jgi:hypothetical protein
MTSSASLDPSADLAPQQLLHSAGNPRRQPEHLESETKEVSAEGEMKAEVEGESEMKVEEGETIVGEVEAKGVTGPSRRHHLPSHRLPPHFHLPLLHRRLMAEAAAAVMVMIIEEEEEAVIVLEETARGAEIETILEGVVIKGDRRRTTETTPRRTKSTTERTRRSPNTATTMATTYTASPR